MLYITICITLERLLNVEIGISYVKILIRGVCFPFSIIQAFAMSVDVTFCLALVFGMENSMFSMCEVGHNIFYHTKIRFEHISFKFNVPIRPAQCSV